MRTLVVLVAVGACAVAAFMAGVWLGLPDGTSIALSDEQMAACRASGGCFIVPKAVIQQMAQETDCGKGRT